MNATTALARKTLRRLPGATCQSALTRGTCPGHVEKCAKPRSPCVSLVAMKLSGQRSHGFAFLSFAQTQSVVPPLSHQSGTLVHPIVSHRPLIDPNRCEFCVVFTTEPSLSTALKSAKFSNTTNIQSTRAPQSTTICVYSVSCLLVCPVT